METQRNQAAASREGLPFPNLLPREGMETEPPVAFAPEAEVAFQTYFPVRGWKLLDIVQYLENTIFFPNLLPREGMETLFKMIPKDKETLLSKPTSP